MNKLEWVSEDPKDRLWQLVRLAVEEAENRYGLGLYFLVEYRKGMYFVHLRTNYGGGGFAYTPEFLAYAKAPPEYFLESEIFPRLREFAKERDAYP